MIFLVLGLITIAFPLYLTVVIAFKQPSEMTNSISGILSLPSSWSLENFREAMRVTDFWNSLGNSLFITLVTVALSIVTVSYTHLDVYKRQGSDRIPQQYLLRIYHFENSVQ